MARRQVDQNTPVFALFHAHQHRGDILNVGGKDERLARMQRREHQLDEAPEIGAGKGDHDVVQVCAVFPLPKSFGAVRRRFFWGEHRAHLSWTGGDQNGKPYAATRLRPEPPGQGCRRRPLGSTR
jgi:hypothetical protein